MTSDVSTPERGIDGPDRGKPDRRRKPVRRALAVLAGVAIVVILLAHVCGAFAWLDWRLELATHFPLQRAIAVGAACSVALIARAFRTATFAAAALVIDLVALAPFVLPQGSSGATVGDINGVTFNLRARNDEHGRALPFLKRQNADFVAVQELTPAWREALRDLEQEYPYSATLPQEGSFGIGLFSKQPIVRHEFLKFGSEEVPSLQAVLELESGELTVIVTHPPPPVNASASAERDRHLRALAQHIREVAGPAVVVGDLNATPWSPIFRETLQESGLKDGRVGRALAPTWPARFGALGIPIDHVLTSPELEVAEIEAGPDLGSDHRPVVFALALRPHR